MTQALRVDVSRHRSTGSSLGGAWEGLEKFTRPFLCAFGDKDPITKGADKILRARIPGARDQKHVTIEGDGHFLQEDRGEELGRAIAEFVRS